MNLVPKILYSRKEAAYALSVSVDSIQEIIHRGLLRTIPMGRRVMIHRDELERFAKEGTPEMWTSPKRTGGKTVRFRAESAA